MTKFLLFFIIFEIMNSQTILLSSVGLLEHYRTRNDDDTDNDHDNLDEIFQKKNEGMEESTCSNKTLSQWT